MKLNDLIKKESERTKQEISFDSQSPEKQKKIFKKERTWLDDVSKTTNLPPKEDELNTIQTPFKHHSNTVEIESKESLNGVEIESQNTAMVSKHPFKQGLNGVDSTLFKHPLNTIVGKEREFLFFIVQECQNNGSLATPPLTGDKLKKAMNSSTGGLKTVIYRLSKKGLIERGEKKNGRSGWVSFRVNKILFDEVVREKECLNGVEMVSKHPLKQSRTSPIVVDSSLNNKLTTYQIQIPEALRTVISKREVEDLLSKNLISETELIQSMESFSYDFSNGLVRAKSNPISLFYGLARSGKVYRSLKLIELENEQLQQYQSELKKLEEENKKLKDLELKEKYKNFKQNNPDFIKKIKAENQFIQSEDMADIVGFEKFLEKTNNERIQE